MNNATLAAALTAALAALSSVSALSLAALVAEPVAMHTTTGPGSTVRAATNTEPPSAAEPGDFADIVARVKPAVISVRVEIDGAQQQVAAQDEDSRAITRPSRVRPHRLRAVAEHDGDLRSRPCFAFGGVNCAGDELSWRHRDDVGNVRRHRCLEG